MSCTSALLSSIVTLLVAVQCLADEPPAAVPGGIQKMFDEVPLPCTSRAVLNHPCYFCKCNVLGNYQHCIYTCSPNSGNPNMPGTKMCAADNSIQLGCNRCRCSPGELFYDCYLAKECTNNVINSEDGNNF
ncbi:uncharacterized protein LOC129731713 [Wyeomyia smithii]|uniref:uncharacterized protein LOC129731713 n=1 Tax=Wyeomyia smithii TaxID=174621 RepID=UPI002468167E|nr:uncharacterized protein LOC129731713 [Wyeomyia smithii]